MNDNPTTAQEQYELGLKYYKGDGVPRDHNKAMHWYTKSAEQGNSYAQVNLGLLYLHKINAMDAIGNSVLENLLMENLRNAAYWFTKAAEQGDVQGQFNLANLYETGAGVTKDKENAKYWYAKAAEQGNSEAQNRLKNLSGGCYVATCVYGSYDCPEVWTLRRFRDNELSNLWIGRCFIRIYYATSPKIVELFGNKKWFSKLWKPIIDKIVCKLQKNDR